MTKRIIIFAPCAYNLAETTRMIEIAKALSKHYEASEVFDVRFISEGGDFESLIEATGFPMEKLEPRMTQEKIEYAYKLDKGEAFGAVLPDEEILRRIENELTYLQPLNPVAIVTGSYITMPITHRILNVPLVWIVQSTWLEDFFTSGAGMTEHLHLKPVRKIADWFIFKMLQLWMNAGLINPLNRAAKHFGVPELSNLFEYYQGDLNLVAEPPGFTNVSLGSGYRYIGPVIAREDFPIPASVTEMPRDLPIIYFAMGSSGTAEIVKNILEGFEGQPYRVIAPVKSLLKNIGDVQVPENVILTDWLPAHKVNKMADISVTHGGIGTIMTSCLAGKPIVGVAMQPEQSANLSAVERKGFAISIAKSKNPSRKILEAINSLLNDEDAKRKAREFARELEQWKGAENAAEILYQTYGK